MGVETHMKFVFLVLHYKNAETTENCIDSILQTIPERNYEIIIVDNASNNGSFEILKTKYENEVGIYFIENSQNLGYARGNNIGFAYAKNTLKADWICLANNDLIFSDAEWISKIINTYQEEPFYVLGPDIETPEGVHQNPFCNAVANKKYVVKKLLHDIIVYTLLKLRIQRKLRGLFKTGEGANEVTWKEKNADFHGVLHGSCLVFSPNFISEYDGLYDGTFLYCEEEILCYILAELRQRYCYEPSLRVTHCHSTSFKKMIKDEDKRKMTMIKHRIKSYWKFVKIVFGRENPGSYLKKGDNVL